jgi:polysaccharide chain length determinant protein (PEP-CTERM system associated)
MTNLFEELRTALYTIWHRRWLALGVAWGICLLGWLVVAMIPNKYEAKTRIFVQLDDPLAAKIGISGDDQKRAVEKVRQTLVSSVNLEKVVRGTRIGDDVKTPKDMESAVGGLSKAVKVVSAQDNLFEITATSSRGSLSDAENAKLSQDIVQKLIDIFRDGNVAGNRGEMAQTLDFMNTQLSDRQKQLEAAEQRRMEFEARNPDLAQGGATIQQRMEASRVEMRGIDADLAAAQSALAAINGQLAGTPQTLAAAGAAGGARGSLAQAQADLAAMRSRGLTEGHPDVIAARNQVNALRAQVQAEGATPSGGIPNPAYSSLLSIRAERQANLQALVARRAAIQTDAALVTARQIANPELAAEAQRINRDYAVLKEQYDKLLADREELRLRGQVETERSVVKFQVIDPPVVPRAPVAPNRMLMLIGVFVLGIAGGGGVAFALGQLRSTFATTGKLERSLGLPVLGAISETVTQAAQVLRKQRQKRFYSASAALGGLLVILLVAETIQLRMVG